MDYDPKLKRTSKTADINDIIEYNDIRYRPPDNSEPPHQPKLPALTPKQRIALFVLSIWLIGLTITGIQTEDNPKSNFMGYKTAYQIENFVAKIPLIGNIGWKWIVRPVLNDFLIRGVIKGIIYDVPTSIINGIRTGHYTPKANDNIILAREILKYEYGILEALEKHETLPPETQKYLINSGELNDKIYDYLLENRLLTADNIMYLFYKNDMAVSEKTVHISVDRADVIADSLNYARVSEEQLLILAKKANIKTQDYKLTGHRAKYVLFLQRNLTLEAYLLAIKSNVEDNWTYGYIISWTNVYNYAYQNVRSQINKLSFKEKIDTYTRIMNSRTNEPKTAAINDIETFIRNMSAQEQSQKAAAELIRLFNHFTGQRIGVK